MKCYFCRGEASVCCPECNRNVCNEHSRQLATRKFGCLECALGGPEGVKQEEIRRQQEASEKIKAELRRLGSCCVCHTSESLVECGQRNPNKHFLCTKHYPKPLRVWQEEDTSYKVGRYERLCFMPLDEFAEYECPVCKTYWSKRLRRVHEGKVTENPHCHDYFSLVSYREHHGGAFAKLGRKDPCPCGSGKKYKDCHGT